MIGTIHLRSGEDSPLPDLDVWASKIEVATTRAPKGGLGAESVKDPFNRLHEADLEQGRTSETVANTLRATANGTHLLPAISAPSSIKVGGGRMAAPNVDRVHSA